MGDRVESMETPDLNQVHRILHVIPTLGSGGAERVLLTYLSQPALKQGFQHLVVLTDVADPHSESPETFLVKLLDEQGVEVVGLGLPGSLNILTTTKKLRSIIRNKEISLVHTHLLWANIAGRIAGRWAGVPVISSFHNSDYDPQVIASVRAPAWKQDLIRRLDGFTARNLLVKSIAVSQYVAQHIELKLGINPNDIEVVYNPIDMRQVQAIGTNSRSKIFQEIGLSDQSKLIVSVGRVTDQKGVIELVEAFAKIAKSNALVHLAVIGNTVSDRVYFNKVMERIEFHGIQERAHLIGPRYDVAAWLASADLFAFPSKYEGMGIALAEAMAAGVACIASDVGPIPELINSGQTGVLYTLNDIDALAHAIKRLLTDDELRKKLGENGQKSILEKFDPANKSQEMADLYRQTIMLFK